MNNTTKETKVRPTLRVDPKTAQRVEQWYKAANCRSQNEFMERAINFYADYIEMNDNNDLLPQALQGGGRYPGAPGCSLSGAGETAAAGNCRRAARPRCASALPP